MATKKKIDFESSMERLEEIVRTLEGGAESLDASLKLYEEGVGLARECADLLEKAEMRMKMLQLKPDGSVDMTDFSVTEDET